MSIHAKKEAELTNLSRVHQEPKFKKLRDQIQQAVIKKNIEQKIHINVSNVSLTLEVL